MIGQQLEKFYSASISRLEAIASGRYWILKITAIALFTSLFFSFPSYDVFFHSELKGWEPVLQKFSNPLWDVTDQYGDGSHASKLNFRLTMPVIANMLHLGVMGSVFLQFTAGVLLLYFTAKIAERDTGDRVIAFIIALLVGSIYAGTTSFNELRGIFDGVAIFFLIIALYTKNPILVWLFISLAAWTDERGLLASVFVILYNLNNNSLKIKPKSIAVMLAWLGYGLGRWVLSNWAGLAVSTGGVGLSVFFDQINMIPMGIWTALEGGWLLVLFSLIALYHEKRFKYLILFGGSTLAFCFASLLVFDITRSMSYILPALFVALIILAKSETTNNLRIYTFTAMLISFLWPAYSAGGKTTIWWSYPLILQLLRWLPFIIN